MSKLNYQPEKINKLLVTKESRIIINAICNYGGEIKFVGGCVRDALLNSQAKDIDLSTNLKPWQTIEALKEHNITFLDVGIKYGTITAVIGQNKYEITSLRKDIKCFGRHAEVLYTDNWEEDAFRRDFTINALYADTEGHIFDFSTGLIDLENKIVRFIGNAEKRIEEDALRILRFFRFSSLFQQYDLDHESLQACAKLSKNIVHLSGERIREEMFKILTSNNAEYIMQTMFNLGILAYIIPGEHLNISIITNLKSLSNELLKPIMPLVVLASIIRRSNEETIKFIKSRWIRANKEKLFIDKTFNFHLPNALNNDSLDPKFIFKAFGHEFFEELLIILWAENYELINSDHNISEYIKQVTEWSQLSLPINGQDLISMGMNKGSNIGVALKKCHDLWVDANFSLSKEDLINYVKKDLNLLS
jgi:poly(A) polymerase